MPNYESFEIDRERFDEFLKEAKDTLKLNKPISKKLEELVKNGVKLRKILGEYISAKEKEEKEVKKEGEDIKKIGVESDKIKKQIEEVVGKEIQSIEEAEKEINSLNEQEKILEKIYKIHTRESKQISIKGTGKKAVSNKIFFKRGIGFLNSISNIGKRIANNGEVEISELILDFKEFNKLMKFINNNLNLKFKAENKEELEKHQQLVDIQKGVEQLGKELFKKDKETEDEEDEIDKETGQIRILFNKALNEVGEEPVIIPEEVPEPEKTIVPKEDGSATNKLLELLKNSSDEETESDDKEDFNHTIVIKLGDEKDIELIVKNSKDETFDVEYVSFIDDDRATYNFKAPIDDKYYVYRKDNKKLIGKGNIFITIDFAEIGKEISEEGDLSSGLTRDQIEKQAVKDQFNVWFGRILGENYSPMKGIWVKIGKGTKFSPKITNEYGLVSFKLKPNKKYEITFQVSDKTIIKKSARYTKTPEGKTVYFFERYRESIEQSGSIIPEDKTFEISINPNEKEGIIVKVFNSKNKEVSVNFQGDWGQDDEEFSIFEFNAPYGRYLIHVELEGYKSRDKKIKFNKITNDIVMYLKKK